MRSRLALVAVVLVVAALIPGARAASGIDRYVATTGVDAGDCSVEAAPCATIQYAVDHAVAGDTVLIAAGTYVQSVNRSPGILLPEGLSIVGAGPGKTIVNGPGSCADGVYSTFNTFDISGISFALRSLSIGCAAAGVQAFGSVTIEDVELLATAPMGVDTGYGQLVVRGATFRGQTGVGIRGGDVTVTGSTFETTTTGVVAIMSSSPAGPGLTLHADRFAGSGAALELYQPDPSRVALGGPIDLVDDWWGCNGGPGTAGCATIVGGAGIPGAEHVTSWLQLVPIDPPATLAPGAQVELRFGLVGSGTKAIAAEFPPTAIALSADTGTLGATSATTAAGVVVVTYTAPSEPGIYTVTAGLDAATAQVALNAPVAVAPPSPSPAADVAAITPPPTATSEVASTDTSSPLPVGLFLGASVIAFLRFLEPRRRRR